MDYSIGSLSDLITGSTTPNKKKVVKKLIISEKSSVVVPSSPQNDEDIEQDSKAKPKKKVKPIKQKINDGDVTKLAGEKRKLSSVSAENESDSTSEKNRNSNNAKRRISLKETATAEKHADDPESLSRTVFVGNLPLGLDSKKIERFFKTYGKVESVHIRGIPVADPKTPKRVAFIKKEFHAKRSSVFGYVRFEERESAIKSLEANRTLFREHHLRVTLCDSQEKPDENKAIFVGNLSFYAEEDDLWKTFECCGPIESVRIVRDSRIGTSKGFGYVNFENSDSVTLALEMENVKIKDRELRINVCNVNAAKKNSKKKTIKKPRRQRSPKKFDKPVKENENTVDTQEKVVGANDDTTESGRFVRINKENGNVGNKSFQGTKFVAKKKTKVNKDLLLKKKKSMMIAPK